MSIVRSLPSSLTRSLGAGSLAPAALPWEDAGGGTSQTALLASLVSSLGGWWWDGRTGIAIAGSGVSSWTDRVQGGVVSQGTDANRPAYAGGILTFDGVNDNLLGTPTGINGRDATTAFLVCAVPNTGTVRVVADWGTVGAGRMTMVALATNLVEVASANNITFNTWDTSAATMAAPAAVWTFQQKFSDGISAAKPIYKNGTVQAGSTTSALDTSGTTTGTTVAFGCRANATLFTGCTMYGAIYIPSLSTAAQIGTITALCRSIYGV